jgi:hypothetical protein
MVSRLLMIMLIFLGVSTVGLLVFDSLQGVQTRKELIRCTTPGVEHDCYRRSQSQMAAAIGSIVNEELVTREVIRIATACADRPGLQTQREVERCIRNNMKVIRKGEKR